jgi:pilus assembly protein CpaB
MNKNMVIVLVGGFLIAVLVAVLVQASLGGKKKTVTASNAPASQILVAARDLPIGATLQDTDMKWQDWPADAPLFPGAYKKKGSAKPTEVVSGRLKRSIAMNEPIVENALIKEGAGNFVAASLGDGMRAVSIDVNTAKMVAGFVGPGDYVDVMLTYKKNVKVSNINDPRVDEMVKLTLNNTASETILQNVKVLAVDQATKRDDSKGEGKPGKTVTLEVDPKGAETLALAAQVGQMSLALRKLGDTSIITERRPVVTDERVTHITREVYEKAHKMAGQNSNVVRIYNGYNVVDQTTVSP